MLVFDSLILNFDVQRFLTGLSYSFPRNSDIMFFCAGFFHCFLIVNQTEIGCEKRCSEHHANIAGISQHSFFDTAQELFEKREKSKQSDEKEDINKIPIESGIKRFYTDFYFNFTSKQWMNSHESYNHSNITFISTAIGRKLGRESDLHCKRNLKGSSHIM